MAKRYPPSLPRMVVGIDIGTTHSAIAFTYAKDPSIITFNTITKMIEVVKNWPTDSNSPRLPTDPKVTSSICYHDPGRFNQQMIWGNKVLEPALLSGGGQPIRFFKLLLLPMRNEFAELWTSDFYHSAENAAKAARKQAEEIVADFLRCIWEHALCKMEDRLTTEELEACAWDIVVTLPANWPAEVTYAMTRVVKLALNLGSYPQHSLTLMAEPDAAALGVFAGLQNRGWKEGNALTIVDAGGATVDIVTYRVKAANPLEIERCTRPVGVLAGFIFLESAVTKVLERKVAELFPGEAPLNQQEVNSILCDFSSVEDLQPGMELRLPQRFAHASLRSGFSFFGKVTITLTPGDVHDIATESGVGNIVRAVAEQVNTANTRGAIVKCIVPVGGYGSNKHLIRRLETVFPGSRYSPSVLAPSKSDCLVATVCGAVVRGLVDVAAATNIESVAPLAVIHLKNQASFGICQEESGFQPKMTWILTMGEEHDYGKRALMGRLVSRFQEDNALVNVKIYACDRNPPPSLRSTEVQVFTNLVVPLNLSEFSNLSCENGPNGRAVYQLPLDIDITTLPGNELCIRTFYNQKQLGVTQKFPHIGLWSKG